MLYQAVVIHWLDSLGHDYWLDKKGYKPHVAECISAGLLIADEEDFVTITCAATKGKSGQYYAPMSIPKVAIISQRVIDAQA